MNLPQDPCHICGCPGYGRAFHDVCGTKWNLKGHGNITKKLHCALEPTFKWLGDLWPRKIFRWGRGFYNPLLMADFCLHGEEESAGFLLWEPVWSSSLVHLRNQPTTAPVDTFCGFQPVCFETGCGSDGRLIKNSHHSVYTELTIKLKKKKCLCFNKWWPSDSLLTRKAVPCRCLAIFVQCSCFS